MKTLITLILFLISYKSYSEDFRILKTNEIIKDTSYYNIPDIFDITLLKSTKSNIFLTSVKDVEYLEYTDTLDVIYGNQFVDSVGYEKKEIYTRFLKLSEIPVETYQTLRLSGRIYKEDSVYFKAKGSEYSRIYTQVLKNTKLPVTFETLNDVQYASVSYDNLRYFIDLETLYYTEDTKIENPYITGYDMVIEELDKDSLKFFEYLKNSTTFKSYFYDSVKECYNIIIKDFIYYEGYETPSQVIRIVNTNSFKELFEDLKSKGLILDNNVVEKFYNLQFVGTK